MGLQKRALQLAGDLIPRMQRRIIDQRSEPRFSDVVDRAVIVFRDQQYIVPVINISTRGAMVECEFVPRIGETVLIQFENCTPIQAFVRWIRQGRMGVNFGHEIILARQL